MDLKFLLALFGNAVNNVTSNIFIITMCILAIVIIGLAVWQFCVGNKKAGTFMSIAGGVFAFIALFFKHKADKDEEVQQHVDQQIADTDDQITNTQNTINDIDNQIDSNSDSFDDIQNTADRKSTRLNSSHITRDRKSVV